MTAELSNINDSSVLRKLFNCLLESVSEDGNWRDFDDSWSPIITAITAELLLNAGVQVDDKWYIFREQQYKPVSLSKSIQFLNSQIREDGRFGTDLWDSIRLGKLIAGHELKAYFSNYDKLHSYIVANLEKDTVITGKSEWRGPGFYASAIDYFDLVKLDELSQKTLEKLLFHQQPDGSWIGEKSKDGHLVVSPVWHTSQAIITLERKDSETHKTSIARAIKWIVEKQENDGSWPALRQFEIYFTSYAIIALSKFNNEKEIQKAVNYLKSQIDNTGKCSDLGGTLMCAIAFWELYKSHINQSMTFMEYLLASRVSAVTNLLENQIQILGNDVKAKETVIEGYKEKYRDAEVVITTKQAWLLGIVLTFLSFGGINGIIQLIQMFREPKSKTEAITPTIVQDTVFIASDTVYVKDTASSYPPIKKDSIK